jgi:hypothetical protein
MEPNAAHGFLAVDDRDGLAELRRGDGALLARWAAPDHDQVIMLVGHRMNRYLSDKR